MGRGRNVVENGVTRRQIEARKGAVSAAVPPLVPYPPNQP